MVFFSLCWLVFSVGPAFSHFSIGSCSCFTLFFAFLPFGKSLRSWNKVFFRVCVCCVAAVWLVRNRCIANGVLNAHFLRCNRLVFCEWEASFQPSIVSLSSLSWCASINGHYINTDDRRRFARWRFVCAKNFWKNAGFQLVTPLFVAHSLCFIREFLIVPLDARVIYDFIFIPMGCPRLNEIVIIIIVNFYSNGSRPTGKCKWGLLAWASNIKQALMVVFTATLIE